MSQLAVLAKMRWFYGGGPQKLAANKTPSWHSIYFLFAGRDVRIRHADGRWLQRLGLLDRF